MSVTHCRKMLVGVLAALCLLMLPAVSQRSAAPWATDPGALLSGVRLTERIADIEAALVQPSSAGAASSVVVASPEAGASVSVSLAPELRRSALRDGYSVFSGARREATAFVAASGLGGQVVFAAKNPTQLGRLAVTFDDGVRSWRRVDQDLLITLGSGHEVAVFKPWAHDATGRSLPTSYVVSGSTLQQQVVADASTVFPVVADPAWSYSKGYSIGSTTSAQAKSKLHGCFNCYFPVSGAPSRFPSPGTNLPLNVANMNFHCKFKREFSGSEQGNSYWGFEFDAKSDHVDGLGSHISFTFTSGRSAPSLAVYAYIVNTNPGGIAQSVYKGRALAKWQDFADNMK